MGESRDQLLVVRGGAALDEFVGILEAAGLHVEEQPDLESLEARCCKRPPAAVLLDFDAPGFDAIDLTRRWKLSRPLYFPSLIFVAGACEPGTLLAGLRTGANLVLTAPFQPEQVVATLLDEMHRFEGMRVPVEHSFVISAKVEYLSATNRFLDLVLHCTEARPDTLEDLRLCMGELGMNAIVHGNRGDASKKVSVHYRIEARRVVVSMADEGEGFHPEALPDPTSPERLLLPTGRGIFLVRQFTDDLSFNERGNEVRFVKRIG